MAMARMRRVCLASAVRAAAARNCEILRFWRVISIADMLPAPRINDVLHRVTLAAVWESPQESGSQAVGIISIADMLPAPRINDVLHRVTLAAVWESPQESGSQAVGIS